MTTTDTIPLSFNQAFELFIKDKKVIGWGFRHPHPVLLPNGYKAYPCGYYTKYENGYKFIASGSTDANEHPREAHILGPDDVPVGYKDREDIIDQGY